MNVEALVVYRFSHRSTTTTWSKTGQILGCKGVTGRYGSVVIKLIWRLWFVIKFNRIGVLQTDNTPCYFSWQNKHVKEDSVASIIICAIDLLGPWLNSEFHIQHIPQMSSWEATIVERLSRRSTTIKFDANLVRSFAKRSLPECMVKLDVKLVRGLGSAYWYC
jgi:hypothetical protein